MLRQFHWFVFHRLWCINHKRILQDGGARGILATPNIAIIHSTGATRLLVVSTMPMQDLMKSGIIDRSTIVVVTKASWWAPVSQAAGSAETELASFYNGMQVFA